MTSRRGETLVACQQRGIEHFGQGDIDGVIGYKVVPQIPNPRQKKAMRVALQWKVGKISERLAPALTIDFAFCRIPADHLRDLHVEQMRRMKGLTRNK